MVDQPPPANVNPILLSPHRKPPLFRSPPCPPLRNLHTPAHPLTLSECSLNPKLPLGSHTLVLKSHALSHTWLPFIFLMLVRTQKGKMLSKVKIMKKIKPSSCKIVNERESSIPQLCFSFFPSKKVIFKMKRLQRIV